MQDNARQIATQQAEGIRIHLMTLKVLRSNLMAKTDQCHMQATREAENLAQQSQQFQSLQKEHSEKQHILASLSQKYTDINPKVVEQRSLLNALEQQLQQMQTDLAKREKSLRQRQRDLQDLQARLIAQMKQELTAQDQLIQLQEKLLQPQVDIKQQAPVLLKSHPASQPQLPSRTKNRISQGL